MDDHTALLLVDADGCIVDLSEAAKQAFGACVGRRCADVVRVYDPAGRSPCNGHCTASLIRMDEAKDTLGKVRGAARRVVCEPLGEHAVVRVGPAPRRVPDCMLTPRELEILGLVADGLTTQDVADRLDIGYATARTHLEHVRAKLGARSRTEAVSIASSMGWLRA